MDTDAKAGEQEMDADINLGKDREQNDDSKLDRDADAGLNDGLADIISQKYRCYGKV
jgi:hypothetical protein